MPQVCKLASHYALTCMSPDENRNSAASENSNNCSGHGTTPMSSDIGDIYVWGSNSSHQLAEGNQEKILQPKQATIFNAVQQVEWM